jgi:integrase
LAWYYRYTQPDGERVRLALGSGLTLAQAREAADTLSRRYQAGATSLRETLEDDAASARAAQARQQREAEALAARGSLGGLLDAYGDALEAAGKSSATRVRASLHRHVRDAHPTLWAVPAVEFTPEQAVQILATLHADGKEREGAKLRAYLRAAFARAVRARFDPKAAPTLRAMAVIQNPVADLPPSDTPTGTRERALSLAELRAYWRRIEDMPESYGALLRLHLTTGAQRVEQLARATVAELDRDTESLTLWDTKGRRAKPRAHVVPLLPAAMAALRVLRPDASPTGPHLFSADGGRSPAGYHVLRLRVARLSDDMTHTGEAEATFTVGDLRRTVETRLAAAGVTEQTRAQLQSHGLGGVQARHYDRHSYAGEKREALETLWGLLTSAPATVTPIRRRRSAP